MSAISGNQSELERLNALKELNILDTPQESFFDNITFLATELCDCPTAVISLIDENRIWFKSRIGFDNSELPRSLSFWEPSEQKTALVVSDASQEPRFQNHPLVLGSPGIRFYVGIPLLTLEGHCIGSLCVVDVQPRSISERKVEGLKALAQQVILKLEGRKAFSDLMKMNNFLADAQRISNFGCWEWNLSDNNVTWSPNHYALFGRDESYQPTFEGYLSHLTDESRQKVRELAENGFDLEEFEVEIVRADGARRIILETVHKQHNTEGKIVRYYGTSKDVTDRKETERIIQTQQAKLIASSRLSALGEMAAGIAHEINNPLGVITVRTSLMRKALQKGEPSSSDILGNIDKIETAAQRVAKIIRSLRSFSKESESEPKVPTDFSGLLQGALDLCQSRLKKDGIEIRVVEGGAFTINCNAPKISQILINLLYNSSDAMQDLEEKWIEIKTEKSGKNLRISVSDSGRGIPPEIAGKMMDPFFSTKGIGAGMGLGLSVSRGIAEEHGGSLIYEPNSQNTQFLIVLPLLEEAEWIKDSP